MNRDQMIASVRREGRLDSDEQAEAGLRATLDALAEAVSGGAADAIAEVLPAEFQPALRGRVNEAATQGTAIELGDAVAARLGLEDGAAGVNVVQASIRAIAEAVDDPERIKTIRDQLPMHLSRMFLEREQGDTSMLKTSVAPSRPR